MQDGIFTKISPEICDLSEIYSHPFEQPGAPVCSSCPLEDHLRLALFYNASYQFADEESTKVTCAKCINIAQSKEGSFGDLMAAAASKTAASQM